MTPRQREAFEAIATGNALPSAHKKTLERLEKCGLIVRLADKVLGRDRFGTVSIPQFEVPIPIHMQWCQWCSEQPYTHGQRITHMTRAEKIGKLAVDLADAAVIAKSKGDDVHAIFFATKAADCLALAKALGWKVPADLDAAG